MKYQLSLTIDFKRNSYPGTYIALEGVDGCGKTTQAEALQEYFEKKGRKVTRTSEPKVELLGGDSIMQYFKGELSISGTAFQYLATANRVVNQDEIVIPALQRGDVVISDRCFWSAIPYGLMDKGVDFSRKEADYLLLAHGLLSQYHQFLVPDTVFYIDISPEEGLKRSLSKKKRRVNDVYEKKDKIENVVKGYRWLVNEFKKEFVILDGEKIVDEVSKELISKL